MLLNNNIVVILFRFVDTCKVFSFAPDNLMSNADVKLTGESLSKADNKMMRDSKNYTELKKPENIKGMFFMSYGDS